MRKGVFALALVFLLLAMPGNHARAGVITGLALEDKGVYQPVVPVKTFTSSMYIKLVSGWGARDGEEHFRLNGETVVMLPAGPPVHVYNLYPVLIHVPQPGGLANPNAPISFFDVFVGDINDTGQIGSLPNDWVLTSAEIIDGYGNTHAGTITLLSDLTTQLPTSNANDTQIQWDLSGIAQKQGRFFLVEYTMTANQVVGAVPEPSSAALAGLGVCCLVIHHVRHRRLARPQTRRRAA
jgi:hypothetical protein